MNRLRFEHVSSCYKNSSGFERKTLTYMALCAKASLPISVARQVQVSRHDDRFREQSSAAGSCMAQHGNINAFIRCRNDEDTHISGPE